MRIAGVQMDVSLKDPESNLQRMIDALRTTAARGARLTVFPECALCGYCFESLDEALPFAEEVPGPATRRIAAACAELGVFCIFGILEADRSGGDRTMAAPPPSEGPAPRRPRVFNAAVLVGPAGLLGSYRKVHLPYLGIDMFTTHGDRPFAVHEAGEVRVGMNICYDAAFPEAARSLALLGADLVALPTNWPPGSQCTAASVINARALENGVYYIAVNRVGTERGFEFIGKSRIADPYGRTIAQAESPVETILYADVDTARARNKHFVRVPGKHEIDRLADRRPEMYGLLVQPHELKSPGRG